MFTGSIRPTPLNVNMDFLICKRRTPLSLLNLSFCYQAANVSSHNGSAITFGVDAICQRHRKTNLKKKKKSINYEFVLEGVTL